MKKLWIVLAFIVGWGSGKKIENVLERRAYRAESSYAFGTARWQDAQLPEDQRRWHTFSISYTEFSSGDKILFWFEGKK